MKKRVFAMMAASLLLFSACASNSKGSKDSGSTAKDSETINIGMDMELSGNVSAYGIAEKEGAELAVEEINEAGGVLGKKINLIAKDNKSESGEAVSVAQNLVTNDKVVAVVGPATSGAVKAALPAVTAAKVPLLTPSGTDDAITVVDGKLQEYAFRTCYQDSFQGVTLAKFANDTLKATKAVIIGDKSSDYGKGLKTAFVSTFKGDIVKEEYFVEGDTDFQAILTNIKNQDFDVLYIPGYYTEAGSIIKQAREMGITQPIVGADGFGDPILVEIAGAENVSDVYYTAHFSEKAPANDKVAPFIEAYKKKYKKDPNAFAALSYDAVYMIKDALEEAGEVDSQKLTEALAGLKDFVGVTGTITIDEDHNPKKPLVVIGLTDGKETSAETINP